ncbi:MAG: ammonium transporter, partial [Rhodococcus sp. (in: high G+C Gram-positive bacteria)]
TIVGAGLGLLGVTVGPLVFATVPGGAAIGSVIGTIAAGGPTLVIAGIDLINTLAAPPGTTKFAN